MGEIRSLGNFYHGDVEEKKKSGKKSKIILLLLLLLMLLFSLRGCFTNLINNNEQGDTGYHEDISQKDNNGLGVDPSNDLDPTGPGRYPYREPTEPEYIPGEGSGGGSHNPQAPKATFDTLPTLNPGPLNDHKVPYKDPAKVTNNNHIFETAGTSSKGTIYYFIAETFNSNRPSTPDKTNFIASDYSSINIQNNVGYYHAWSYVKGNNAPYQDSDIVYIGCVYIYSSQDPDNPVDLGTPGDPGNPSDPGTPADPGTYAPRDPKLIAEITGDPTIIPTLTFDGTEQKLLSAPATASNGTPKYASSTSMIVAPEFVENYVSNFEDVKEKFAGSYYVWYFADGAGNYENSPLYNTGPSVIVIAKFQYPKIKDNSVQFNDLTYNESRQRLIDPDNPGIILVKDSITQQYTNIYAEGTVEYAFGIDEGITEPTDGWKTIENFTAIDAGDYYVWARPKNDSNVFDGIASYVGKATIKKATGKIKTDPTASTLTYNKGAQQLLSRGATGTGTKMYYTVSTIDSETYSSWEDFPVDPTKTSTNISDIKGQDAGEYWVYYACNADDGANGKNYIDSEVKKIKVIIAKKNCTVTLPTGNSNLIYNHGADITLLNKLATVSDPSNVTIKYAITTTNSQPTSDSDYSYAHNPADLTNIKQTNAGTYYVWVMVTPDTSDPIAKNYNKYYSTSSVKVDIKKYTPSIISGPKGKEGLVFDPENELLLIDEPALTDIPGDTTGKYVYFKRSPKSTKLTDYTKKWDEFTAALSMRETYIIVYMCIKPDDTDNYETVFANQSIKVPVSPTRVNKMTAIIGRSPLVFNGTSQRLIDHIETSVTAFPHHFIITNSPDDIPEYTDTWYSNLDDPHLARKDPGTYYAWGYTSSFYNPDYRYLDSEIFGPVAITIDSAPALTIKTDPTAKSPLTYTGSDQLLLNPTGSTNEDINAIFYYQIADSQPSNASLTGWTTNISTLNNTAIKGKDAKTYKVYYFAAPSTAKVNSYSYSEIKSVEATIGPKKHSIPTVIYNTNLRENGSTLSLIKTAPTKPTGGTVYYAISSTKPTAGTTSPWTTDPTAITATTAGTYKVWVYVKADNSNYEDSDVSSGQEIVVLSPAPALPISAPIASGITYDGNAHLLLSTGATSTEDSNASFYYLISDSEPTVSTSDPWSMDIITPSTSLIKGTDAKTYKLWYFGVPSAAKAEDYSYSELKSLDIVISPLKLTAPNDFVVYDDLHQSDVDKELIKTPSAAITGGTIYYIVTDNNTKPSFSEDAGTNWSALYTDIKRKNKGTYYIWTFVKASDTNHSNSDVLTTGVPVTIGDSATQVTVTPPVGPTIGLTYNKEDQALLSKGAKATPTSTIYYYIGDSAPSTTDLSQWTTTDYTTLKGKNAGTYKIWYFAKAPNGNYLDSTPAYIEVEIDKAQPIITKPRSKTIDSDPLPQSIFTPGVPVEADGGNGTFYYAFADGNGESHTPLESEWNSYPASMKQTDPGVYYIWWKFIPADTDNYYSYEASTERVLISEILDSSRIPEARFITYPSAIEGLTEADAGKTFFNPGSTNQGTIKYAVTPYVNKNLITPDFPDDYTITNDNLPVVSSGGDFYVWYYIDADGVNYSDTEPVRFLVHINTGSNKALIDVAPKAIEGLLAKNYDQKLVTPGITNGTGIKYAVTLDNVMPDKRDFSAVIPTGKVADTYYVWYYAVGNNSKNMGDSDISSTPIEVVIMNGTAEYAVVPALIDETISGNANYYQYSGSPITLITRGTVKTGQGVDKYAVVDDRNKGHIPEGDEWKTWDEWTDKAQSLGGRYTIWCYIDGNETNGYSDSEPFTMVAVIRPQQLTIDSTYYPVPANETISVLFDPTSTEPIPRNVIFNAGPGTANIGDSAPDSNIADIEYYVYKDPDPSKAGTAAPTSSPLSMQQLKNLEPHFVGGNTPEGHKQPFEDFAVGRYYIYWVAKPKDQENYSPSKIYGYDNIVYKDILPSTGNKSFNIYAPIGFDYDDPNNIIDSSTSGPYSLISKDANGNLNLGKILRGNFDISSEPGVTIKWTYGVAAIDAIRDEGMVPEEFFSESLPTAPTAGTYAIWYRVEVTGIVDNPITAHGYITSTLRITAKSLYKPIVVQPFTLSDEPVSPVIPGRPAQEQEGEYVYYVTDISTNITDANKYDYPFSTELPIITDPGHYILWSYIKGNAELYYADSTIERTPFDVISKLKFAKSASINPNLQTDYKNNGETVVLDLNNLPQVQTGISSTIKYGIITEEDMNKETAYDSFLSQLKVSDTAAGDVKISKPGVYYLHYIAVPQGGESETCLSSDPVKIRVVVNRVVFDFTGKVSGRSLTYNNIAQELVTLNNCSDEDQKAIVYAVSQEVDGSGQPVEPNSLTYTLDIPRATAPGTYYIWYKTYDTEYYIEGEADYVETTIASGASQFATYVRPPYAINDLVYNKSSQRLILKGLSEDGVVKYYMSTSRLDSDEVSRLDPKSYTETVPTATNAGTYYIYYKIFSSTTGKSDTPAEELITRIDKHPQTIIDPPTVYSSDEVPNPQSGIQLVTKDCVSICDNASPEYFINTADVAPDENAVWVSKVNTKKYDPGIYYIWYRCAETDNYYDSSYNPAQPDEPMYGKVQVVLKGLAPIDTSALYKINPAFTFGKYNLNLYEYPFNEYLDFGEAPAPINEYMNLYAITEEDLAAYDSSALEYGIPMYYFGPKENVNDRSKYKETLTTTDVTLTNVGTHYVFAYYIKSTVAYYVDSDIQKILLTSVPTIGTINIKPRPMCLDGSTPEFRDGAYHIPYTGNVFDIAANAHNATIKYCLATSDDIGLKTKEDFKDQLTFRDEVISDRIKNHNDDGYYIYYYLELPEYAGDGVVIDEKYSFDNRANNYLHIYIDKAPAHFTVEPTLNTGTNMELYEYWVSEAGSSSDGETAYEFFSNPGTANIGTIKYALVDNIENPDNIYYQITDRNDPLFTTNPPVVKVDDLPKYSTSAKVNSRTLYYYIDASNENNYTSSEIYKIEDVTFGVVGLIPNTIKWLAPINEISPALDYNPSSQTIATAVQWGDGDLTQAAFVNGQALQYMVFNATRGELPNTIDDSTWTEHSKLLHEGSTPGDSEYLNQSLPGEYYIYYRYTSDGATYNDPSVFVVNIPYAPVPTALHFPEPNNSAYAPVVSDRVLIKNVDDLNDTKDKFTIKYALSTSPTDVPSDSEFVETVPTYTSAGTYYVWYLAKSKEDQGYYYQTIKKCLTVTIDKGIPQFSTLPAAKEDQFFINDYIGLLSTGGELLDDDNGDLTIRYYATNDHNEEVRTNGTITFETDPGEIKGKEIGDYIVYYYVNGSENYYESPLYSVSAVIQREALNIVDSYVPTPKEGLVYNGNELTLVNDSKTPPQNYELRYAIAPSTSGEPEFEEYSKVMPKGVDAGTYNIWWLICRKGAGEIMYGPISMQVEVAKKEATDNVENLVEFTTNTAPEPFKYFETGADIQFVSKDPTFQELDGREIAYALVPYNGNTAPSVPGSAAFAKGKENAKALKTGKYRLFAYIPESKNYTASSFAHWDIEIIPPSTMVLPSKYSGGGSDYFLYSGAIKYFINNDFNAGNGNHFEFAVTENSLDTPTTWDYFEAENGNEDPRLKGKEVKSYNVFYRLKYADGTIGASGYIPIDITPALSNIANPAKGFDEDGGTGKEFSGDPVSIIDSKAVDNDGFVLYYIKQENQPISDPNTLKQELLSALIKSPSGYFNLSNLMAGNFIFDSADRDQLYATLVTGGILPQGQWTGVEAKFKTITDIKAESVGVYYIVSLSLPKDVQFWKWAILNDTSYGNTTINDVNCVYVTSTTVSYEKVVITTDPEAASGLTFVDLNTPISLIGNTPACELGSSGNPGTIMYYATQTQASDPSKLDKSLFTSTAPQVHNSGNWYVYYYGTDASSTPTYNDSDIKSLGPISVSGDGPTITRLSLPNPATFIYNDTATPFEITRNHAAGTFGGNTGTPYYQLVAKGNAPTQAGYGATIPTLEKSHKPGIYYLFYYIDFGASGKSDVIYEEIEITRKSASFAVMPAVVNPDLLKLDGTGQYNQFFTEGQLDSDLANNENAQPANIYYHLSWFADQAAAKNPVAPPLHKPSDESGSKKSFNWVPSLQTLPASYSSINNSGFYTDYSAGYAVFYYYIDADDEYYIDTEIFSMEVEVLPDNGLMMGGNPFAYFTSFGDVKASVDIATVFDDITLFFNDMPIASNGDLYYYLTNTKVDDPTTITDWATTINYTPSDEDTSIWLYYCAANLTSRSTIQEKEVLLNRLPKVGFVNAPDFTYLAIKPWVDTTYSNFPMVNTDPLFRSVLPSEQRNIISVDENGEAKYYLERLCSIEEASEYLPEGYDGNPNHYLEYESLTNTYPIESKVNEYTKEIAQATGSTYTKFSSSLDSLNLYDTDNNQLETGLYIVWYFVDSNDRTVMSPSILYHSDIFIFRQDTVNP